MRLRCCGDNRYIIIAHRVFKKIPVVMKSGYTEKLKRHTDGNGRPIFSNSRGSETSRKHDSSRMDPMTINTSLVHVQKVKIIFICRQEYEITFGNTDLGRQEAPFDLQQFCSLNE